MIQWSEMIDRHRKEEWELLKNHLDEQKEALNRVIETVQASQMKQLEAKYERLVFFYFVSSEVKFLIVFLLLQPFHLKIISSIIFFSYLNIILQSILRLKFNFQNSVKLCN